MADTILISTYDLGHQPFGLASPAAWLKEAGAEVATLDLSVESVDEQQVAEAILIGIYLPMHTATRLAVDLIPELRQFNPQAHLCCYGLYATPNEEFLRSLGADSVIGGEFETALVELYMQLNTSGSCSPAQEKAIVSLERQRFMVPVRTSLPSLDTYAHLVLPDGRIRRAGYTEATRGCKHLCQHCPVVPIYEGRFRIVQKEIVLADIRQQVDAGAEHITFGDPDFMNGPGHAIPIVKALHADFPDLTYDVTIKVEHLLTNDHLLPTLRDTGCVLITTAVESMDDSILDILDKGHTEAGFKQTAGRLQEVGITLNPTFVAFTPWTTPESYLEMLRVIRDLGLVENVSPIQYAIRLLIPAGSRLLERADVQDLVGPFNQAALSYPWKHPEKVMDDLYVKVFRLVRQNQMNQEPRLSLFNSIWQATLEETGISDSHISKKHGWDLSSKPVPQMSESWY